MYWELWCLKEKICISEPIPDSEYIRQTPSVAAFRRRATGSEDFRGYMDCLFKNTDIIFRQRFDDLNEFPKIGKQVRRAVTGFFVYLSELSGASGADGGNHFCPEGVQRFVFAAKAFPDFGDLLVDWMKGVIKVTETTFGGVGLENAGFPGLRHNF